jgi:hypothetical protein
MVYLARLLKQKICRKAWQRFFQVIPYRQSLRVGHGHYVQEKLSTRSMLYAGLLLMQSRILPGSEDHVSIVSCLADTYVFERWLSTFYLCAGGYNGKTFCRHTDRPYNQASGPKSHILRKRTCICGHNPWEFERFILVCQSWRRRSVSITASEDCDVH